MVINKDSSSLGEEGSFTPLGTDDEGGVTEVDPVAEETTESKFEGEVRPKKPV